MASNGSDTSELGPPNRRPTPAASLPPDAPHRSTHVVLIRRPAGSVPTVRSLLARLREALGGAMIMLAAVNDGGQVLIIDMSKADAETLVAQIEDGDHEALGITRASLRPAASSDEQRTRELIRAAATGDPIAQDRLYRRLLPIVERGVFRVLGPTRPVQQHEEAAQEAMIAIFDSLPRFLDLSAIEGFAYKVATNRAKSYLDKSKTPGKDVAEQVREELGWADHAVDSDQIRLECRELLSHLKGVYPQILTPHEAALFRLQFIERVEGKELQKRLGKTRDHVKVIRFAMRRKLTVFSLRFQLGGTVAEIAHDMNLTKTQVHDTLRSIRSSMRP